MLSLRICIQMRLRLLKCAGIYGTVKFALSSRKQAVNPIVYAKSNEPDQLSVFDLTTTRLEADCLFDQYEIGRLYSKLQEFKDMAEVEIQWRRARALREYAKIEGKNKKTKESLIREALSAAKYALELDSNHWAAHKWYGIMLGDVSELEGTQQLLESSPQIKHHFEQSINLHHDPTTIYCLGVWHFRFTELPWYKRKAASIYFGVDVPISTYNDALG